MGANATVTLSNSGNIATSSNSHHALYNEGTFTMDSADATISAYSTGSTVYNTGKFTATYGKIYNGNDDVTSYAICNSGGTLYFGTFITSGYEGVSVYSKNSVVLLDGTTSYEGTYNDSNDDYYLTSYSAPTT